MAHIESDLMLIALLTKSLEIIDNDSGVEHESLRKTLEAEIRTIKTRLGNVLKPINPPKKDGSKLSKDDKQFIMDELSSILGGKFGNTQTWQSSGKSQFASQMMGDFLSSILKYDWENEDEIKKKDEEKYIIKKKNVTQKKYDKYKPINWDDIDE